MGSAVPLTRPAGSPGLGRPLGTAQRLGDRGPSFLRRFGPALLKVAPAPCPGAAVATPWPGAPQPGHISAGWVRPLQRALGRTLTSRDSNHHHHHNWWRLFDIFLVPGTLQILTHVSLTITHY